MKTAALMAFKDMYECIKENNIQVTDRHGDTWVVTPAHLMTKETRRLNAELGINKLNYYGNKNGKK